MQKEIQLKFEGEGLEKIPLYWRWFQKKVEEISKLPLKPQRAGLRKRKMGEPFPMSRIKTFFALLKTMPLLKANLKDLAPTLGIAYTTLRHWNNNTDVFEREWEFEQEFIETYVKELIRLTKKPETGRTEKAINRLYKEARFYGPVWRVWIFNGIKGFLRGEDLELHLMVLRFQLYSMGIMDLKHDTRENIEVAKNASAEMTTSAWDYLAELIRKGEKEHALELLKAFKDQDLNTDKSYWDLRLLYLEARKKGGKSRTAEKAAAEKVF